MSASSACVLSSTEINIGFCWVYPCLAMLVRGVLCFFSLVSYRTGTRVENDTRCALTQTANTRVLRMPIHLHHTFGDYIRAMNTLRMPRLREVGTDKNAQCSDELSVGFAKVEYGSRLSVVPNEWFS